MNSSVDMCDSCPVRRYHVSISLCSSLDLNQYGPVKNGLARGSPFTGRAADISIGFGLHRTNKLGYASITRKARFRSPIELSLQLLMKQKLFRQIASATNAFARGRGASEALLTDWRDTDWKEMFRFFLANLLIASITYNRKEIADDQLFDNPLLAGMVGPRRYQQLTRAFRLKRDDQTPDEFVDFAAREVTRNVETLLRPTVWVYNLQTYRLNLECQRTGCCTCSPYTPRAPKCSPKKGVLLITLLKVANYVIKFAFHKTADDTQMSGNMPTASPSLLERLLDDVPLKQRFFVAAGCATLEMANYFHVSCASCTFVFHMV